MWGWKMQVQGPNGETMIVSQCLYHYRLVFPFIHQCKEISCLLHIRSEQVWLLPLLVWCPSWDDSETHPRCHLPCSLLGRLKVHAVIYHTWSSDFISVHRTSIYELLFPVSDFWLTWSSWDFLSAFKCAVSKAFCHPGQHLPTISDLKRWLKTISGYILMHAQ